jgi:ParB family chromosome partitioning protein
MPSRHGLGKGLDALIPDTEERTEVSVSEIRPTADQPRRRFPEDELRELADSIRIHGILQPLVVAPDADGYKLIAGERRLRAAKLAGLRHVPVHVRTTEAQQHYELALIENLQRSDLSPVEEAHAFQKLIDDFGLTQEALAKRLGKSRPAIANTLRLLGLEPTMLRAIEAGELTAGHANALLARQGVDRIALFNAIRSQKLSVRQAEAFRGAVKRRQTASGAPDWVQELERVLGTRVELKGTPAKGRLVIHYHARDELESLLERLQGE